MEIQNKTSKKINILSITSQNSLLNKINLKNMGNNLSIFKSNKVEEKKKKLNFSQKFYFFQNQIISSIKEKNEKKSRDNFIIKKPSPISLLPINKSNVNKVENQNLIHKKNENKNHLESKVNLNKIRRIHSNLSIYERGYLKPKRQKRFCLKYFDNLVNLLTKISKGKRVHLNEFDQINHNGQKIFLKIFLNKYKNNISKEEKFFFLNKKVTNVEKFENIMNFLELKKFKISSKRKEENMKFIFNTIIKKLKIKFFQEKNYKFNTRSENIFYKHYFQKKDDSSISNIFSRRNIALNTKILSLYFSFPNFKEDFLYYLKKYFKNIYLKHLYKKWENLFKRYEKRYLDFSTCCEKFLESLNSKKKFKYPWNIFEVENSIKEFHNILNHLK